MCYLTTFNISAVTCLLFYFIATGRVSSFFKLRDTIHEISRDERKSCTKSGNPEITWEPSSSYKSLSCGGVVEAVHLAQQDVGINEHFIASQLPEMQSPCCQSIQCQLDSACLLVIRLPLADKSINNCCRGSIAWPLSLIKSRVWRVFGKPHLFTLYLHYHEIFQSLSQFSPYLYFSTRHATFSVSLWLTQLLL